MAFRDLNISINFVDDSADTPSMWAFLSILLSFLSVEAFAVDLSGRELRFIRVSQARLRALESSRREHRDRNFQFLCRRNFGNEFSFSSVISRHEENGSITSEVMCSRVTETPQVTTEELNRQSLELTEAFNRLSRENQERRESWGQNDSLNRDNSKSIGGNSTPIQRNTRVRPE